MSGPSISGMSAGRIITAAQAGRAAVPARIDAAIPSDAFATGTRRTSSPSSTAPRGWGKAGSVTTTGAPVASAACA